MPKAPRVEKSPRDLEALAQDGLNAERSPRDSESKSGTSSSPAGGQGPWSCQEESPGEAAPRGVERPLRSPRRLALRGLEGQGQVLCVSRRSVLLSHPEEQLGDFSARQEPGKARAFSESERSGRGARPRRGPGGRQRRLRLGAVSSRGRRASPVPAAPRAGGLRGGSIAGK